MKVLAIIPLRTGSKRLPNKNFLSMCNKPLYWWVLREATACEHIDKVVVSTDADKRSFIPENYDIIMRPKNLSGNDASTEDVVDDVIERSLYYDYDIIMVIQVTTPSTNSEILSKAIKIFIDNALVSLVSVDEQYAPNGAFYIIRKPVFVKHHTFWVNDMAILKMSNRDSVDVDHLWQFRISESLMKGLIYNLEDVEV